MFKFFLNIVKWNKYIFKFEKNKNKMKLIRATDVMSILHGI